MDFNYLSLSLPFTCESDTLERHGEWKSILIGEKIKDARA